MSTMKSRGDAQFVASCCTTSSPRSSRQEGFFARAKAVLAKLEAQDRGATAKALVDDLPLFATPSRAAAEPEAETDAERLKRALEAVNPDDLSPREALEALYRLKAVLGDGKKG